MRGINGGNLITPIVSSFHVCFSLKAKMERSIFGELGKKISWPHQKSSNFLFFFYHPISIPTKHSLNNTYFKITHEKKNLTTKTLKTK